MTAASKIQREPTRSADPPKYILVVESATSAPGRAAIVTFDERPTMDHIRNTYDVGTSTLYSGEGRTLRHFRTEANRNGNLKIVGTTPEGLEALSTLNLERLAKMYVRIVKIWPAKAKDASAILREVQGRSKLVESATFPGITFDDAEDES